MSSKKKNIYYCVGCGVIHTKNSFYQSDNRLHANGVLPYCKDFIKKYSYNKDGSVNIDNFKFILMIMDSPFLYDIFETSIESSNETVGNYFKNINSLNQYKGFRWRDSRFKDNDIDDGVTNENAEIIEKSIDGLSNEDIKQLEERWGIGYSSDELYLFEKKRLMLRNNYTEKTAMHTEALYNYIRYRVKEEIATAEGNVKEAKDWGSLASKAATDAKINPSQLSKADLTEGLSTFSELSQAVEQEVDIIRILPKFKFRPNDALDFNLWCYINYERHLSGLPLVDYEDVYKFYDERIKDYIEQYGDPYDIFKDDPMIKNRESIKKFIEKDDDKKTKKKKRKSKSGGK